MDLEDEWKEGVYYDSQVHGFGNCILFYYSQSRTQSSKNGRGFKKMKKRSKELWAGKKDELNFTNRIWGYVDTQGEIVGN